MVRPPPNCSTSSKTAKLEEYSMGEKVVKKKKRRGERKRGLKFFGTAKEEKARNLCRGQSEEPNQEKRNLKKKGDEYTDNLAGITYGRGRPTTG